MGMKIPDDGLRSEATVRKEKKLGEKPEIK
jgi:hypothetical protein